MSSLLLGGLLGGGCNNNTISETISKQGVIYNGQFGSRCGGEEGFRYNVSDAAELIGL